MTSLTILQFREMLSGFKLVLEGKTGKEIPESSRLEFLEKFSANNFALSDAEDNTSEPLNRGGVADLPLLRTLLLIHQKSQEPSFWEVMDSFVLSAYASLAASRTLLQQLLACLNFTLESEDLSFFNCRFFLNRFTIYCDVFVLLCLISPCLVVVVWSESQLKKKK